MRPPYSIPFQWCVTEHGCLGLGGGKMSEAGPGRDAAFERKWRKKQSADEDDGVRQNTIPWAYQ
jgi:hypothetical protein